MAIKITPDAQLATVEAIKNRITQLEKDRAATRDAVSVKMLSGRIRALQARLSLGSAEKTSANPALLKSKNDMM
jgi:hypothetical protein